MLQSMVVCDSAFAPQIWSVDENGISRKQEVLWCHPARVRKVWMLARIHASKTLRERKRPTRKNYEKLTKDFSCASLTSLLWMYNLLAHCTCAAATSANIFAPKCFAPEGYFRIRNLIFHDWNQKSVAILPTKSSVPLPSGHAYHHFNPDMAVTQIHHRSSWLNRSMDIPWA